MVWIEPTNHITECCFCAIDLTMIRKNNRSSFNYPDFKSASCHEPYCNKILVLVCGELSEISDEDSPSAEENKKVLLDTDGSRLFSHEALNNLVCNLSLLKISAKLLASRLKENKLISNSARIAFYRNRHKEYLYFFF